MNTKPFIRIYGFIGLFVILTGCSSEKLLTSIYTLKPDLSCRIAEQNCDFNDSVYTLLLDTFIIRDTVGYATLPDVDSTVYGDFAKWWDDSILRIPGNYPDSTRYWPVDTLYLETEVGTASASIDSGRQWLSFKTRDSLKIQLRYFKSRTTVLRERLRTQDYTNSYKDELINNYHDEMIKERQAKKTWRGVALIFIFVTLGGIFVTLFWS